ncbi:prepilin-type N-terminal cleavage/methylation domain-containing protein [Microbacterium sp. bgisy189]|uniref:prepilin-type N-terminal cleavage/methylation domain-containing protein n=1 Tax=Microbacterium sp. bgisy189 TaxID=3413798 RepID=UPI003EB853C7
MSVVPHDDEGLTLVELIVVIVVSALFLGLLALMFINGITAQERATARDHATGESNVVSATLMSSVRNAEDFRISGSGTRVDARVVTADDSLVCRAWAVVGGDLRYRESTTQIGAVTTAWTTIATDAVGTLGSGAAFELAGAKNLRIGFEISTGDETVAFRDGVAAQAETQGTLTCW